MAHQDSADFDRNDRNDRNDDGDARRTASSDHPQVAALGDLGDYEVAEGYPDVRGWEVKLADGRTAGKVHELIVDTGSMRTRYLDVRLDRDLAGAAGERDVLVPIGTARLDGRGDNVLIDGLSADQIAAMPAYEHGSLTRDHERTVRSHFSGGSASATGGAASTGSENFYDHEHFDDRSFFGGRTSGSSADQGDVLRRGRTGGSNLDASGSAGMSGTDREVDRTSGSGLADRVGNKLDDVKDRFDGNPASRPGPDATDRR